MAEDRDLTDEQYIRKHFDLAGYFEDREHRELAEARLSQVIRERDAFRAVLEDIYSFGLRADMRPTMNLASIDTLYADFVRYLGQLNESVRNRARRVLVRR
jgi:hypothetical protein